MHLRGINKEIVVDKNYAVWVLYFISTVKMGLIYLLFSPLKRQKLMDMYPMQHSKRVISSFVYYLFCGE